MALFHPDHPDHATVILNRHGLYDRRWSTGIIAWCDIRDIRRIPAEKTIVITLHNPRGYLSSMTFFKRLMARIRLWLNLRTLYLDTSSLGARTQDILIVANRLWLRNRGKGRLGKKRRIRIGKSRNSRSRPLWSDYE